MTVLLDANVLIALLVVDHVHHDAVEDWFSGLTERFATCPITQGAVVRLVVREGATAAQATTILGSVTCRDDHEFWPDDLSYDDVAMTGVVGHRQVTDAYLAGLARHRGSRCATLDHGLAATHADVALLVPAPASGGHAA